MRGEQQVTNLPAGKSFRQQITQCEKVAERFAHFLAFYQQMRAVQPMFDKSLSCLLDPRSFALRDFVLMMREHQVFTPQMEIEDRAEELHAHGAALDVPSGPPFSPRGRPKDLAVLGHPRLPQCEISHRLLLIFIAADSFTYPHFLEIQFHELAVLAARVPVFLDAEINRAVCRFVSETASDELLDERDDVRYVFRRAGRLVWQAAVQRAQVLKKRRLEPARELAQRRVCFTHALDDLVVHVGNVHDLPHGVALEFETSPDKVAKYECSPIADVREVVNRRAAAINANFSALGIERAEVLDRARQRIE